MFHIIFQKVIVNQKWTEHIFPTNPYDKMSKAVVKSKMESPPQFLSDVFPSSIFFDAYYTYFFNFLIKISWKTFISSRYLPNFIAFNSKSSHLPTNCCWPADRSVGSMASTSMLGIAGDSLHLQLQIANLSVVKSYCLNITSDASMI